jgi:hypothetical protein
MISEEYLGAEDSRRLHAAHAGILDVIPQSKSGPKPGEEVHPVADLQLDKMTLFTNFFKQRKGQEPSEELKELFHEILNG